MNNAKLAAQCFLLALCLVPGPSRVSAAPFTFVCRADTIQQVEPGSPAEFGFTLTNTGTEADVYRLDCRVLDSVPGWFAVCCVHGLCFEPGIPLYDTLAAGEADTTVHVTIYTNTTHGEELVNLKVTSLGNPMLTDSITTHTRVGSGITESTMPGTSSCAPVATILRGVLNTGLRLTADGSRLGIGLYDANGRKVMALLPGPNDVRHLAPGVYFVCPAFGAERNASSVCKVVLE